MQFKKKVFFIKYVFLSILIISNKYCKGNIYIQNNISNILKDTIQYSSDKEIYDFNNNKSTLYKNIKIGDSIKNIKANKIDFNWANMNIKVYSSPLEKISLTSNLLKYYSDSISISIDKKNIISYNNEILYNNNKINNKKMYITSKINELKSDSIIYLKDIKITDDEEFINKKYKSPDYFIKVHKLKLKTKNKNIKSIKGTGAILYIYNTPTIFALPFFYLNMENNNIINWKLPQINITGKEGVILNNIGFQTKIKNNKYIFSIDVFKRGIKKIKSLYDYEYNKDNLKGTLSFTINKLPKKYSIVSWKHDQYNLDKDYRLSSNFFFPTSIYLYDIKDSISNFHKINTLNSSININKIINNLAFNINYNHKINNINNKILITLPDISVYNNKQIIKNKFVIDYLINTNNKIFITNKKLDSININTSQEINLRKKITHLFNTSLNSTIYNEIRFNSISKKYVIENGLKNSINNNIHIYKIINFKKLKLNYNIIPNIGVSKNIYFYTNNIQKNNTDYFINFDIHNSLKILKNNLYNLDIKTKYNINKNKIDEINLYNDINFKKLKFILESSINKSYYPIYNIKRKTYISSYFNILKNNLNNTTLKIDGKINYMLENFNNENKKNAEIEIDTYLNNKNTLQIKNNITFNFKEKKISKLSFDIYKNIRSIYVRINWTPIGYYPKYIFSAGFKSDMMKNFKLTHIK